MACSTLHTSLSATRRQYKARSESTHLPCTGMSFGSLR